MSLKIGRCGLDVALDDPSEWGVDANTVSLTGELWGSSADDVASLRQQLNGHALAGDWVPVIWSEDSTWDGIYRVESASITTANELAVATHRWDFSATLARHPRGAATCRPQSRLWGALRANDHSITAGSTTPWHAVPNTATVYAPNGVDGVAASTRAGDGVTLDFYDPGSQVFYDARIAWRLPLADWYDGSPTLEVGGYPVVGAQIVNDPTDWTFGNGLIEFSPGSGCALKTRMHDGSAWGSNAGVEVGCWNGGVPFGAGSWVQAATAAISVEMLPGAHPGWAAIKLDVPITVSGVDHVIEVEISLRRGARMAECVLRTTRNGGLRLGVRPDSTGTATDTTGLVYLDTAVSTHKLCFASAETYSCDTSSTGTFVATSAVNLIDVGIGWENAGASSADPDRDTDLKAQYFGPVTEIIEVG